MLGRAKSWRYNDEHTDMVLLKVQFVELLFTNIFNKMRVKQNLGNDPFLILKKGSQESSFVWFMLCPGD